MNRRYKRRNGSSKIVESMQYHLEKNLKAYIIVSLIFLIGIIIGIIVINNSSEDQKEEISTYIYTFTNDLKENKNINDIALLLNSVKKNTLLVIFLWFMGSTVIGMSIVYITICFRGFCFGYTISSIILALGNGKGIIFAILTLLLQNIIFIPSIFALAVSGINLHNSIMEDRRKENIKVEILRHTAISVIILAFLVVSSLIEVYISKNFLLFFIKYF